MSSLAATSLMAANTVTQWNATLNSSIATVGQDPTDTTVVSENQASLQTQASMDALKLSLNAQQTQGNQLAQMLGLGNSVDTVA